MLYFKIFVVLLCNLVALYLFLNTVYVLFFGAPAIPSSFETAQKLKILISKLYKKKNFVFLDLGCGTGRLIMNLAKKFGDASFIGVEVNPVIVSYCRLKKIFLNQKNVRFVRANIFDFDVKKYNPDFIYLYLGENLSKRISKKLEKDVSLNTYIISNKFELSFLKLVDVMEYNKLINGPLRIYKREP